MATNLETARAFLQEISLHPNATARPFQGVLEAINIDSAFKNTGRLVLINLVFHGEFRLKDVTLVEGIKFVDCTFLEGVFFDNVTINGHIPADMEFHSVQFESCTIKGSVILHSKCILERGIKVSSSTLQDFQIHESESPLSSVSVEGSTVESITISHSNFNGQLSIRNTSINGQVRFEAVNVVNGVAFIKGTFKRDIFIWAGDVGGIVFNENEFKDEVKVVGVKIKGGITTFSDTFTRSCRIDTHDDQVKGGLQSLAITGSKFMSDFTFRGHSEVVPHLQINCSDLTGTMFFFSTVFLKSQIANDNQKANLIFNDVLFDHISFKHFSNFGNLVLSSCGGKSKANSIFETIDSNLGKAQFLNFSFANFHRVNVIDSIISNIEFSGIVWFDRQQLEINLEGKTNHFKVREVYRQLKHASDRQNDRFQYLEFHAEELRAFQAQLASVKHALSGDRIALWLGQTNDFGQNWKKPLVIIICITVFIFFLITVSASATLKWYPACSSEDVNLTFNELKKRMQFLPQMANPVRNLSNSFEKTELDFWVYALDAFHRITLAFFVVQIVSAFRKFYRN